MDSLEKFYQEEGDRLFNIIVQYAKDITLGKEKACKAYKRCAKRFLNDLKKQTANVSVGFQKKVVPIYFDKRELVRVNEWAKLFRHVKGVLAGQPINLTPFQLFIVGNIFCWKKENGKRRYKKVYIQVARKNAKTQLLAIISSYFAFNSSQMEEVYIAGWGRDQSDKCFKETVNQLKGAEGDIFKYQSNWDDSYHKITFHRNGSSIIPLSKEARKTGDGSNPSLAIIDEYHCHETNEIVDSLTSGDVARDDALLVFITTPGFNLNSPCYKEYEYASSVLDENTVVENDEYFSVIMELDSKEEIDDPEMWIKSNPIVCSYPEGQSNLYLKYTEAVDDPTKLRSFITKNLGLWIDSKDKKFMDNEKWKNAKIQMPDITGQRVYIGTDLSNKIDLCSHGFEFPDLNFVMQHSFLPEDILWEKIKKDKVPYDLWIKQGYITKIDGAVIDDDVIIGWLEDFCKDYELSVQEVCFDPWSARQYAIEMENRGFTMVEIRQGLKTLSEPTKNFRAKIYKNELHHSGDPVLQFAVNNAVTRDSNGNIMIDKDKSEQKIDPLAAVINAHCRAMYDTPAEKFDPNQYADEDFLKKLWG